MKLTLQLQLLPNPDQKADLLATMERFNEAATFAAEQGFAANVYGQVSLHHIAYRAIRQRFGLSAQMAVRAIAKAVECFQRDKTKCPVFKPRSAVCYDQRVLSFKGLTDACSRRRRRSGGVCRASAAPATPGGSVGCQMSI
jgi:predicted transposase